MNSFSWGGDVLNLKSTSYFLTFVYGFRMEVKKNYVFV